MSSRNLSRGSRSTLHLLEKARGLASVRSNSSRQEALRLLQLAARRGNAEANYAIGTWYLYGRVVPKDYKLAAKYLDIAARKNFAPALFDSALLYEKGNGVKKNLRIAFERYLEAANLGDTDALKSVARCVYYGIGTTAIPKLGRLIQSTIGGTK